MVVIASAMEILQLLVTQPTFDFHYLTREPMRFRSIIYFDSQMFMIRRQTKEWLKEVVNP